MPGRSLRWVRDVLSRSIQLEQRRNASPANTADARRGVVPDPALALLVLQRADLGARLLVHDPQTQAVRNLFVVHDELGSHGWAGVRALPLQILAWALTEAEILAMQEPSSPLTSIIDALRSIKTGAEARAAQALEEQLEREWQRAKPQAPEVSESNFDEYELMERSWVGTVPAGLDLSERAPPP